MPLQHGQVFNVFDVLGYGPDLDLRTITTDSLQRRLRTLSLHLHPDRLARHDAAALGEPHYTQTQLNTVREVLLPVRSNGDRALSSFRLNALYRFFRGWQQTFFPPLGGSGSGGAANQQRI